MARIPAIEREHLDPELAAVLAAGDLSWVEEASIGVIGRAPHMLKAIGQFEAIAMKGAQLPRRLIELVRLRVAFHNQCRTCMAVRHQSAIDDGLTEELVCSLERPMEAPNLNEREKAALQYADLFATNHFAINDDTYASLRQHFCDAEIVELGVFVGYFTGMGRFMASLDITEQLPGVYREKSRKVGPWESSQSVLLHDV